MNWTEQTTLPNRVEHVAFAGEFKLRVFSVHGEPSWFLTCQPFFEYMRLRPVALNDAKAEAVEMVRARLEQAMAELV